MASRWGRTDNVTSIEMPITIEFRTVPRPGRSRSGIQHRSTAAPIASVAAPIDSGVCFDTPSASTVHGELPSSLATSSASPMPKIHSPTST